MKRTLVCAMVCFLVLNPAARGDLEVGVIDLLEASEKYVKTADLEDEFDALRQQFKADRQRRQEEIERMVRALEEQFKPGTPDYETREKELLVKKAEFDLYSEREETALQKRFAQSLKTIFDDIRRMAGVVAEERGLDLVLVADQRPTEEIVNPSAMRQYIAMQRVIYHHPRLEITDEVIDRLNMGYKTLAPQTPGDTAPQAPAGAPGSTKEDESDGGE
jgi:Skp family chaperone for outer membrane proteins